MDCLPIPSYPAMFAGRTSTERNPITIKCLPDISLVCETVAMATNRVENNVATMAFSIKFVPFAVSRNERLDAVIARMNGMPFDRTDCSLPMPWAMQNKVEADAFVIYTDSETYAGKVHPVQALRQYQDKMSIAARLIIVGMVSSGSSIADPAEPNMLDLVGFDTSAPAVISEFAAGRI